MFCFSCGQEIKKNDKFCPNCGVDLISNSRNKSEFRSDKGRLLEPNTLIDDRSNLKSDENILIFKNKTTKDVVKVNKLNVRIGAFLVTPIFFLLIGEMQHALSSFAILFLISLLSSGSGSLLVWLGYAYYSYISLEIVEKKWIRKGYVKI
tara:strand:- start:321 stop:770 length:450 start_codon:yes stop_codon:yes gene_type:complete